VVGDSFVFEIPAIVNEAVLDYKFEFVSGPKWSSFSQKNQKLTFKPSELDFFEGKLALGKYEVELFWNAKSQTDYAGSYLGIAAVEGTAAENFYQKQFIALELVDMPAELKPQLKAIRNLTDYLEVELNWVYPVKYGDQLSFTVDASRRLAETSVELLGELFIFQIDGSLTMPLITLKSIDEDKVVLKIAKAEGGQFSKQELLGQNLLL